MCGWCGIVEYLVGVFILGIGVFGYISFIVVVFLWGCCLFVGYVYIWVVVCFMNYIVCVYWNFVVGVFG